MNGTQRRRFERLSRVAAYMQANGADFPDTSKGGQATARLLTVIEELERLDAARVTSVSSKRQATVGKQAGRAALRAQLFAISDTAATIALDHPEFRGRFDLSRANISDQTLLSTARAFATAAAPSKARFVEYDLPADFLERLNASIASFEQHAGQQTAETGARVVATASLEDALARGEQELERIDTAVNNKHRGDAARLAAWASARRLEHARRAQNGDTTQKGGGDANPAA